MKKCDLTTCYLQETHFKYNYKVESKRIEKYIMQTIKKEVGILISDILDFRAKKSYQGQRGTLYNENRVNPPRRYNPRYVFMKQ